LLRHQGRQVQLGSGLAGTAGADTALGVLLGQIRHIGRMVGHRIVNAKNLYHHRAHRLL
jgi:hypothetical protein